MPINRAPEATGELLAAVRQLVELKAAADELVRRPEAALADPGLRDLGPGSMNPLAFLRACLPFLGTEGTEPDEPLYVPLAQLVGESCRWLPDNVPEGKREERLAYFLHPDRSDESKPDPAEYFSWPDLGLFAAHEGKNRVAFLRSCGVAEVPASVAAHPYPASTRIRLYTMEGHGVRETWAVLDGRWVARPPLLRLGLRLLSAYGVPAPKPWPGSYPRASDVLEAWPRDLRTRVDLQRLAHLESVRDEVVPVSALDIPALHVRIGQVGRMIVGLSLVMLACAAVGGRASFCAAAAFGALLGGAFTVVLPLFRARRGWLDGQ